MRLSQTELIDELKRIVIAGDAKGILIRAIGGLAVQLHNRSSNPLFEREYADLDLVVAKKQRREFEVFMSQIGYSPDRQFNILNGDQRQIYFYNKNELKIDIFVGDFEMCHKIPLETRLSADPVTIPLAELLLSKAQIVQVNRKDMLDITSILLNNEIGDDDKDKINLQVLAALCSNDWGLYKTTSINLQNLKNLISKNEIMLSHDESALVNERIEVIEKLFETMPKPLPWQLRDRVGTRVKWYIEVEEVDR